MAKRPLTKDPTVRELARRLDRTTRVLKTLSMQIKVLDFGQRELVQRVYRLEQRIAVTPHGTVTPRGPRLGAVTR